MLSIDLCDKPIDDANVSVKWYKLGQISKFIFVALIWLYSNPMYQ